MASSKEQQSLVENARLRQDTGFGATATSRSARLMDRHGRFNVRRKGQSFLAKMNSYNRLITMPPLPFISVIFLAYFLINLFFATLYYILGVEHLHGAEIEQGLMSPFWTAFFFSSQTLTTVGYGSISPTGYAANTVASMEALIGLMMFAIITGLLYGRFSKPRPRILFSDSAIVSPYQDTNGLMFRIINEKSNQLINVSATVHLSRNEMRPDGTVIRKYYPLPLERSDIKYFATNWTIVHPITPDSPLYGETQEGLEASDAELLIAIEATDDTYFDPIHIRKSYLHPEIDWGYSFESVLSDDDNHYVVDLSKISQKQPSDLNE